MGKTNPYHFNSPLWFHWEAAQLERLQPCEHDWNLPLGEIIAECRLCKTAMHAGNVIAILQDKLKTLKGR